MMDRTRMLQAASLDLTLELRVLWRTYIRQEHALLCVCVLSEVNCNSSVLSTHRNNNNNNNRFALVFNSIKSETNENVSVS